MDSTSSPESDTRPYGVIIIRSFGDLPLLGGFSLMTSGFLTDGKSIPGSAISHIEEEKIRELLSNYIESEVTKNSITLKGYRPLEHTDHRLAIEDLVRVLPRKSHCLIELCTMPPECVERIIRILNASRKRVIIYKVTREIMIDRFPKSVEDKRDILSKGRTTKGIRGGEQEQFTLDTKDEREKVEVEISSVIGHLRDLGANVLEMKYDPEDCLVKVGDKTCELLTTDGVIMSGEERVLYNSEPHIHEYLKEYPDGGSMKAYPIAKPIGRTTAGDITPDGDWNTLFINPMRVSHKRRNMNITTHTEITCKTKKGDDGKYSKPFKFLTWHRSDLRTLTLHHEPMNMQGKVL